MTDAELRSAIEVLRCDNFPNINEKTLSGYSVFHAYLNAVEDICELAERVLDAKVPEKKACNLHSLNHNDFTNDGENCVICKNDNIFNSAIDSFRLILARDYVKKSEIPSVDSIQELFVPILVDINGVEDGAWSCAEAIRNLLTKG